MMSFPQILFKIMKKSDIEDALKEEEEDEEEVEDSIEKKEW